MRRMNLYAGVGILLCLLLIGWFAWSRVEQNRANRERARMIQLDSRQSLYETQERGLREFGLKPNPAVAKPLTDEEKLELEELRHRVGKWRADHPNSP